MSFLRRDLNGDLRLSWLRDEEREVAVLEHCAPGDEVVLDWDARSGVRRDFCSTWLEVLAVEPRHVEIRISTAETRRVRSRAVSRIRQRASR